MSAVHVRSAFASKPIFNLLDYDRVFKASSDMSGCSGNQAVAVTIRELTGG
ncbi:MAG: hypothetical protein KJ573_06235 [Proteobacteria bacterium]|nr:hypothetical protein [Desulfobacteraceae bacterium]MBU0732732.1 hypothetical protein [Pseudomonadota bacterium]MBU1903176.1 hypothetical protein [Pseudomonadota bacterium]